MSRFSVGALSIAIGLFPITRGLAATDCDPWIAEVVSAQGTIEAKRHTQTQWIRVQLNDTYCAGDSIRAALHSRAGLLLRNQTVLRLDQGTTIVLPEFEAEKPAWLELIRGAAHLISNIPYRLKVKTPFINAAIEGTEFALQVTEKETRIWVFEGKVVAENAHGRLSLENGDAALAEAGKAPMPLVAIKPRDAVQWALYYPPIIDYRPEITADPIVQQAIDFYRTGQIAEAIAALSKVPKERRNTRYLTLRAGLLLSVGRVDQARSDINQAQTLEPNNATSLALLSVIALVQNQKEQALDLAQQAAGKDPQSPTPQVALSYAYQAAFDIETARDSIKKALELSPDDPLAWARLSELELSLGELDDALEAAEKAAASDPELPRTQMVLGFAHLMRIDLDAATEAFQKAIELDPAAPLPRLGQGLVKIRRGDVEEGTKDIEVAAILDPDNSLVRSYLGKAYYEEKRGGVASREFAIAKELDPKDPTPWFYDAILKQTTNRPVEALHDMQKAIELNDNRAVYRSQLLLDDDLAARSAAIGRIYNDLGFQQLGLVEGWKSVNSDPSNYSAHRLLADNYAALPRHEVARVSELLQSQLLQPINITPVQPQLAESNLLILEGLGPQSPSFNEFNPLFARNRLVLQASGVYGSNDTWGDEVTQSGLWNKFSYSLGQFHFETDGFRDNADLKEDIYNAFVQGSITPNISAQIEVRNRKKNNGDLDLKFDSPDPDFNQQFEQDSARVGLLYKPTPKQSIIASYQYLFSKDEITDPQTEGFTVAIEQQKKEHQAEFQHLYSINWLKTVTGFGYVNLSDRLGIAFDDFSLLDSKGNSEQYNGYLYSTTNLGKYAKITLGVSYDSFRRQFSPRMELVNPKLGLIWDVTSSTTLRLAAFQVLAGEFSSNQTIEPTQVSGFNQFFDDSVGTKSKRYGIALDHRFSRSLFAGLEFSWRDVERLIVQPLSDSSREEDQDEEFYRAYLHWALNENLALTAEYRFEDFEREKSSDTSLKELTTHTAPIELSLRFPNGLFAKLGGAFIHQDAKFDMSRHEKETFGVIDASIGYRFPKRYGIISLDVKNLFEEDFDFQDSFNPEEQRVPQFQPDDRTIFVKAQLQF